MGYVAVKFLGEDYQVPETINEFLQYDELLTPIRTKVLSMVSADAKKDSILSWDADIMTNHVHSVADNYRKIVEDGAKLLVKKLLELGVYDVTASDLLNNISAIEDITKVERGTFAILLEEGQRYVDMKDAGVERAYNYAASNITGSGVRVFTSSVSTLMINSVVERSILMSQAKKADKEYEEAVKAISARTVFALDKLYREVMVKEFYPSVMRILLAFDSQIMGRFLEQLVAHDKFDFDSVEKYNMAKADEMLKNIGQVPDKKGFLKQTFLICPFSSDLNEKTLELGLLDAGTFETAKYFGMAEELIEKMEDYIHNHLKEVDKITPLITILATNKNTDEKSIWRNIYRDLLTNIEGAYQALKLTLSDNAHLCRWIKDNITHSTDALLKKSIDDIMNSVTKSIDNIISENEYQKYVSMDIIKFDTLRLDASQSTDRSGINAEIVSKLMECIKEYITEATKRRDAYLDAQKKYDDGIQKINDEISGMQQERSKLGLFAFSKKKEMNVAITDKESQLEKFKKDNAPDKLFTAFEKMYI